MTRPHRQGIDFELGTGRILLGLTSLVCLLWSAYALPQNPHNLLADWIPSGRLQLGDAASEKATSYETDGKVGNQVSARYRDGEKAERRARIGATFEKLKVTIRQTRHGRLSGQLVIVRHNLSGEPLRRLTVSVNGTDQPAAWPIGGTTKRESFIPEEWSDQVYAIPAEALGNSDSCEIKLTCLSGTYNSYGYKFYIARDWDVLAVGSVGPVVGVPSPDAGRSGRFLEALAAEWAHEWSVAIGLYDQLTLPMERNSGISYFAGWHRRRCELRQTIAQGPRGDGEFSFWMGKAALALGCYEEAAAQFAVAAAERFQIGESTYLMADSLAYVNGDAGDQVGPLIPLFEKAAKAYKATPNTWRVYVGIFKKMWWMENGQRVLREMTDQQVAWVKQQWEWASLMVNAASRGHLKLDTTYRLFTDEVGRDDKAFYETLWKPGDFDCFMKVYEGGPAETLGMDCGPNRTAICDIGTWANWEVYLHEWNHMLDWTAISTEEGVGVPVTHSSDWCGFQPIASMGQGHRSCNRYYFTEGMYKRLKGYDRASTPYIRDWLILGPYECKPKQGLDQKVIKAKGLEEADLTPQFGDFVNRNPWLSTDNQRGPFIDITKVYSKIPEACVVYAHTYVYVPTTQEVRMWLGQNDRARVWVNGTLVHRGLYAAIVNWEEANEPDQLSLAIPLREGWNSILLKVENFPKTPEELRAAGKEANGFGFSVRLCDFHNAPIAGLKTSYYRPPGFEDVQYRINIGANEYASWPEAASDYTRKLRRLELDELKALTGFGEMTISSDVLILPYGKKTKVSEYDKLQFLNFDWKPEDRELNNQLNWNYEMAAVVRYPGTDEEGTAPRDLLFLKPEAVDTYLKLLQPIAPEDQKRYGIRAHQSRVLGYLLLDREDSPNGRALIVVDTYLGPRLPSDERSLLRLPEPRR